MGDRNRFVDQVLRGRDAVDEPELERLLRGQHLVLAHRVRDDQLHRRLRSDQPRRQLGRAPGRDEPEQALGRGDVAHVVRDHPVVAVQRELDAASQHRRVDRGDGRIGKRADASEEVMPGAASFDRLLARLDARELVQIGPAGEAPGLARDDERRELALLELGQQLGERLERAPPEDVGPALARPVVHRHERQGVTPLEVKLRDGVGHARRLSSRG